MQTAPSYVPRESPPSVYAAAAVVEGQPGAWTNLVMNTLLRAVLLMPGLAIGGVRDLRTNVTAALTASGLLSGIILIHYYTKSRDAQAQPAPKAISTLAGLPGGWHA